MYLLIAVVAVMLLFYGIYVSLIKRRNQAREALASIDVQLRKRHDLIPNIVTLAQKYMTHEKELLTQVVEARNRASAPYSATDAGAVKQHLEAERQLQRGLVDLFAVAESYPEMRSADTIITAQQTLNEVEGHISAARRFYNSAVGDLNNAVEIWPGSMIANTIGVSQMPFFEIEEAARAPVNVGDLMD